MCVLYRLGGSSQVGPTPQMTFEHRVELQSFCKYISPLKCLLICCNFVVVFLTIVWINEDVFYVRALVTLFKCLGIQYTGMKLKYVKIVAASIKLPTFCHLLIFFSVHCSAPPNLL